MEDKTFAQAIDELNQKALKEITAEALHCWTAIQQGTTIANATAHLTDENMREAVSNVLFYVILQSILYNAKQHALLDRELYEELKGYIDNFASLAQQQHLTILLDDTFL